VCRVSIQVERERKRERRKRDAQPSASRYFVLLSELFPVSLGPARNVTPLRISFCWLHPKEAAQGEWEYSSRKSYIAAHWLIITGGHHFYVSKLSSWRCVCPMTIEIPGILFKSLLWVVFWPIWGGFSPTVQH
jgi:hypothetical protein